MSSTGHRIRAAAVAARAELLKLASTKPRRPGGEPDGRGQGRHLRRRQEGHLRRARRRQALQRHPDDHVAAARRRSPSKPVSQYKLVGTQAPRIDIPAKVTGRFTYTHAITVPGMLHARWIRPGQGPWLTDGFAKPLSVDESSIKHLPNVKVLQKGDFIAVVGKVEYEVVQAAAQLKVKWAESPILPGHANLWSSFRKADTAGNMPARITGIAGQLRQRLQGVGEDRRRRRSATRTTATTRSARPAPSPTTRTTAARTRTSSRCSPTRRTSPARSPRCRPLLGLARPNQVRIIYYEGSSSYGNGYHYLDINDSAALISKLAGAPIRLQLMRWDEQGWTRYGPAIMHDMRGGIDANGNIQSYEAVAFAQASTNDAGDARARERRRAGDPGLRRHERREPGADVQRREQQPGQSGLPARLEDPDPADGHVPERHAARAVGPADDVRVGAVRRHARRSRPAWIRTTSGSRTSARTDRSGRRGEWPRYTGVLDGGRRGVGLQAARLGLAGAGRPGQDRLGHGDRHAQRLVRRVRRQGHASTPRRARSRSSTSGPVRTRASRSTRA